MDGSDKKLIDQVSQAVGLPGEDHGLAVLRETLAADPVAYGGHRILKGVFTVIDHRREEFQARTFALGGKLYNDSPKVFTYRIGDYCKAWVAELKGSRAAHGRRVAVP